MWMDHTRALEHLMKQKLGLDEIKEVSSTDLRKPAPIR